MKNLGKFSLLLHQTSSSRVSSLYVTYLCYRTSIIFFFFPEMTIVESGERDHVIFICHICEMFMYHIWWYLMTKYGDIWWKYMVRQGIDISHADQEVYPNSSLWSWWHCSFQYAHTVSNHCLFELACFQPQKISQPNPWVKQGNSS